MSVCIVNTSAIDASRLLLQRLVGACPLLVSSTSSGATRTRAGCPAAAGSERTVPVSRYRTPSSSATVCGDFAVARYWLELARAMTTTPGIDASRARISSVSPSATYASSGRPRFSNGSTAMRRTAVLGAPESDDASLAPDDRVRDQANSAPEPSSRPMTSSISPVGTLRGGTRTCAVGFVPDGTTAASSAWAKSAALAYRSAGEVASERATAASSASGMPGRMMRAEGAAIASRLAITACCDGPVNGGSPVSIS